MSNIEEKVVVITGASSGLGEAAARLLASKGAKVVLGARRKERLEAIVAEIERAGGTAGAMAVDVTKRSEVEAFVQGAITKFGRMDVLVNNAGLTGIVVAGAPSYLEKRGAPLKPADLLHHDCIGFRMGSSDGAWAWELERGKRTLRIPVRGPVMTNDSNLRRLLAVAGVGLIYGLEPAIGDDLAQGRLRVVLPQYAPKVPGLFLYFPSRAQVSPALKAFVRVASQMQKAPRPTRGRD